jgi:hypothetical protein
MSGRDWFLIADEVEATSAVQAVIRAADGEGHYRACGDGDDDPSVFWVPAWGPPEPLEAE